MTQKFQRGNIVKILFGHPIWQFGGETKKEIDMNPEEVGKLAVIEFSYAEKYGGNDTSDYSVIFLDNGVSVAWKSEEQLEFIEQGGEHVIEEVCKKREKMRKMNSDLGYIKNNWKKLINDGMSSDTVLYLFNKIGFESSFAKNGEYFTLWIEWHQAQPLFDLIFNQKSKEKILEAILDEDIRQKVDEFYDEIQKIS